jgi:elongation factor P--(R)-beta-lysine ligase
MNRPLLRARALLLDAVRDFFRGRNYTEVETPILVPAPPPEPNIDPIPAEGGWLRPSPELRLKEILADGWDRLFEIGPCFRKGESGRLHRPQYTMLEWYRTGAGYREILEEARDLVLAADAALRGMENGPAPALPPEARAGNWPWIPVEEAFAKTAGWNPIESFDPDRFDLDLVDRVEPAFSRLPAWFLHRFPTPLAALARLDPDDERVAERGELYIHGMELANAYTELTDPGEHRRRFDAWNRVRSSSGRPTLPSDEGFFAALERGLPPCAGAALGIDRLVMALTGVDDIGEVRVESAHGAPAE